MNQYNSTRYVSDSDSTPVFIIPAQNKQVALEWSAVLESQGIEYELQRDPDDGTLIFLFINEDVFTKAMCQIDAYEHDRPFFERFRELFTATSEPVKFNIAFPVIVFSAMLISFYFICGPSENNSLWYSKGMLSVDFFHRNEWWRPVTALTLHADFAHVAGNVLFFLIFGTAAVMQAGGGTVLFFSVLSGIMGNLCTLYLFGDRVYNALGFSTSVFGLLGILAALRLMQNVRVKRISSFYFWIPLVAAVAVFGLTGTSAGSDIAGHSFGFVWGAVFGVLIHFLIKFKQSRLFQFIVYVGLAVILLGSWYFALR